MAKEQRLGGKDGCGNFYPSTNSTHDSSYQPRAESGGLGFKDGAGRVANEGDFHDLEVQPSIDTDGVGGKTRGHGPPNSLKRMQDDADGYTSEDRRFRKGGN